MAIKRCKHRQPGTAIQCGLMEGHEGHDHSILIPTNMPWSGLNRRDDFDSYPSLRKTPWARIWRAARAGKGVRLSPEDCRAMIMDDAVATRGKYDNFGTMSGEE